MEAEAEYLMHYCGFQWAFDRDGDRHGSVPVYINDKSFQRLCEGAENLTLEDTGVTLHTFSGEAVRPD